MARNDDPSKVVDALLGGYGQTYAKQAGFTVEDKPSALFRLLCLSLLLSARISADIAVAAARALADEGWTTADDLAGSTWARRAKVLNEAGYARYDERTSVMLGETADLVVERWKGDLRNLRREADRDPAGERRLLKRCKGIGDVGVDIFFREVQPVWEELYPFADDRVLRTARALGLGDDAGALADRVDREDYPRLVAALVRVDLSGDPTEIVDELVGAG